MNEGEGGRGRKRERNKLKGFRSSMKIGNSGLISTLLSSA